MSEQIDKIFREKLGRYKAPVSSAPDIWAAIATDQASKRKRSRLMTAAKYAGVLLLLLAIAGPGYNYFSTSAEEPAGLEGNLTEALVSPILENNETTLSSPATTKVTADAPSITPPNNAREIELGKSSQSDRIAGASAEAGLKMNNQAGLQQSVIQDEQEIEASLTEVETVSVSSVEEEVTPLASVKLSDRSADQLPTLPLPILSPRLADAPAPTANVLDQEQQRFERSKKNRLEIDLLAGPAYANQIFSLDDETDRDLLNAREISEFPTVSFLAGVRASYRLSPRWSFRTGLLYTQVRNQFEYEQQSVSPSESPILIKSSNQINMLEVPLLASFTLPGKRFRLALNAGPVINVSTNANGRYLLPDLMEPVSLEEDNIYRSNVGISYQFSFTAAYDLGMGNSLLIEPTFKSYRTSFTHRDYVLNERYWLAGLQIGLRHRIR